jgi:integrase
VERRGVRVLGEAERSDGARLPVRAVGAVAERPGRCPPWVIVGVDGHEHEPTSGFLRELVAGGCSALTCRSYAYDLLHFLGWLATARVAVADTTSVEVCDYVLWLRSAPKSRRPRKPGSPAPGSINAVTGKAYLAEGYAPATINHRLSVLRRFFDHQQRSTGRPATNPVPAGERPGERLGAHRSPMEPPPAPRRRGPYRQKTPDRPPRWIPDQAWAALFAALSCDRDRAVFTMLVASGARAEELCGMRGQDVEDGRQAIRLVGKGSREERWVATSPESLTWLARYLAAGFAAGPGEPLWWTVRGARRALSYWTLRAVLARANRRLGSNWVLHDLRHTCAMRLASDPEVTLVGVDPVL